jgi:hypothetical protein
MDSGRADTHHMRTLLAVLVCRSCPIRRKCLEFSLRPLPDVIVRDGKLTPQLDSIAWGVWGGVSRQERAKALRELGDVDLAVDELEATFGERLSRRLTARRKSFISRQDAAQIEEHSAKTRRDG